MSFARTTRSRLFWICACQRSKRSRTSRTKYRAARSSFRIWNTRKMGRHFSFLPIFRASWMRKLLLAARYFVRMVWECLLRRQDLCLRKIRSGKSRDYCDAIKLHFQYALRSQENETPAFLNSSGVKIFFEKLRFRCGSVWTVSLTVKTDEAAFSNFFGVLWTFKALNSLSLTRYCKISVPACLNTVKTAGFILDGSYILWSYLSDFAWKTCSHSWSISSWWEKSSLLIPDVIFKNKNTARS